MHRTCTAALANTATSFPQSQNASDLFHGHLWNMSRVPMTCGSPVLVSVLSSGISQSLPSASSSTRSCKGSGAVLVSQPSRQPGFTLGHTSWPAKTSGSGKQSPAWNYIPFVSQTCGKERGTKSSFKSLRQPPKYINDTCSSNDKGNMSWSWLFLFYRQDLSLFPPAAEAEQCSSSPPWCWAVFHSQKRDLSMSWAIQASSVWDGDQRARNGSKNCRLLHESRATLSDQSLPRSVTVPPWDTFHPELPSPRGTSSPKCHSNITTTPKLYGVQRVAKWANTPI